MSTPGLFASGTAHVISIIRANFRFSYRGTLTSSVKQLAITVITHKATNSNTVWIGLTQKFKIRLLWTTVNFVAMSFNVGFFCCFCTILMWSLISNWIYTEKNAGLEPVIAKFNSDQSFGTKLILRLVLYYRNPMCQQRFLSKSSSSEHFVLHERSIVLWLLWPVTCIFFSHEKICLTYHTKWNIVSFKVSMLHFIHHNEYTSMWFDQ